MQEKGAFIVSGDTVPVPAARFSSLFRYYVISLSRLLSLSRYHVITKKSSRYLPCPIALWVSTAAPEFLAGVDAFLCHTFNHGLATKRTGGRIGLNALFLAIGQTLGSKPLRKTSLYPECIQLALYLAANHEDESITKHQYTVSYHQRIVALQSLVKLVLLVENVNAALVQHIVLVGGTV